MESLEEKERGWSQGRAWAYAVLAVLGLTWLVLGATDWGMRFRWFQWHRRLIFRPPVVRAPTPAAAEYVTNLVPEWRGGDLTRLVGIRSVVAPFEDVRPGGSEIMDAEGFRNAPVPPDVVPSIVVVGDSFMASGEPMTNMFALRLSALADRPVCNRAVFGVGPFISFVNFVDSDRFKTNPPRMLIWGFVEREIIRHGFSSLCYQLDIREKGVVPPEHLQLRARAEKKKWLFSWRELSSTRLKKSLPDTSAFAQYAQKIWNQLRYVLFRELPPEVVVSTGDVQGRRLLLYAPAVRINLGDPSERNPEEITWAIGVARDFLAKRGIQLVVVMIPDKETVYQELIPPGLLGGRELPPSCLDVLEPRLHSIGVPVVNLLPAFRAAAAGGELLYWPDDTHWNERGIRLAAEQTWTLIAPRLPPP